MKSLLFGIIAVLGVTSGPALATATTGGLVSDFGGGMYATEDWAFGGAELTWSVSESGGLWTYVYNFNVNRKEVSHFALQVSDTFTEDNIFAGTTAGWDLGTWTATDQGASNPGIPGDLYGIKFDFGSLENIYTVVTDRAPMWGSFYAKDGKSGGDDVYAYNTDFGGFSSAPVDGSRPGGFLLVPDTLTSVPLPGALPLFLSGLMLMGLVRRKTA